MELSEEKESEWGSKHLEESLKCLAYLLQVQPLALWQSAIKPPPNAVPADLKDSVQAKNCYTKNLQLVTHSQPKVCCFLFF